MSNLPKASVIIGEQEYLIYHNINVPGVKMYTPAELVKDENLLRKLAATGRNGIETRPASAKSAPPSKPKS